ncbi:YeiH family protein [Ramlibacter alkalitolerans]|uniref:Sulfate exporter family transporter n=1 Tax=Ramlibacter alkalitolerans TaxID=2039631 RepID=A0ABS1JIP7_9BURK|nr:putative sulfate exporter family transporter [Ramlibacter alkalitolerans]MBL0424097.1 putative sulfate exporter family transporter [Ramlibacter alkalitolerans]
MRAQLAAFSAGGIGDAVRAVSPGLIACAVVGAASAFLSDHYGGPVMLFALLLGMAMNFLSADGACRAGIEFAARQVLRVGIALLGLRITGAQVVALGWEPAALVVGGVAATIAVSVLAARVLGFDARFGLLTGGATAICGASAALALSAALSPHPLKERATLFTVIGVSALSTLAMVLYPVLTGWLGLSDAQAGLFLGATIHDVAQVVGAGYSISTPAGDAATLVKLMRVATLLPVIVLVALGSRAGAAQGERPPLLPGFALGFALLVAINSFGWIPSAAQVAGSELSRWCLLAAIAGIGMKTHLRELVTVGWRPVLLMLGETLFLAGLVLVYLRATS